MYSSFFAERNIFQSSVRCLPASIATITYIDMGLSDERYVRRRGRQYNVTYIRHRTDCSYRLCMRIRSHTNGSHATCKGYHYSTRRGEQIFVLRTF